MANAGYLASNIAQNVRNAGNVALFFRRTGDSVYTDLGDIGEFSMTPSSERTEHFSNRKGINAVVKILSTQIGLSMEAVLNEINPENLRYALFGGSVSSGSINVLETATPAKAAGGSSYWDLAETVASAHFVTVQSANGETTYALTTDYSLSVVAGVTRITAVSAGMIAITAGTQIYVQYVVQHTAASGTRKFELLSSASIVGQCQFRIRNNSGGLAQIIELAQAQITPNGAIGVPTDEIQTLPITITAEELNGTFGTVYMKSIADA